jgi:hypothetical protein
MTGRHGRLEGQLTEDHLILVVVAMLTAVNVVLSIASLGGSSLSALI